jgi:hypothetical protein
MTFDYRAIIAHAMVAPFFDTAPPPWSLMLQIRVEQVSVPDGQPRWEAICGYHLPNSGGNPNIYLSAVNQAGIVEHPQTTGKLMMFGWDWEGRRPGQRHDPVKGDKPLSEPSANINLGRGQIATVWVEDSIPSDKVYNLRSDWPDAVYHSATFVCFRLVTGTPPPPEPEPEPAVDCADLERRIEGAAALMRRALELLEAA